MFKLHVALAISCTGRAITIAQAPHFCARGFLVERLWVPKQYVYTLHVLDDFGFPLECETSAGLLYPRFREELERYVKMGFLVLDAQPVWKPYTEDHLRLWYDESGKASVL